MAGRINVIAPFFPFSPNEQAVVAHKFLLSLHDEAQLPLSPREPENRYIGHSHINIIDDGSLCQHVAKNGYVKALGARSINNAVNNIRRDFAQVYSKSDTVVEEVFNSGPMERYTIQLHPVSETVEEVSVFRDGVTTGA